MMRRGSAVFWIVLCGALVIGMAANGETNANTASSTGMTGNELRASVGVFVVERGASLAFEIVRGDPCPCLCDPVYVTGLSTLDSSSATLREEFYDPPVDTVEWLGRLALADSTDGQPLPEGSYTVVIATTAGTFSADIRIVLPQEMARSGRFSASASVCGLELRVYRLITQDDAGASVSLRRGDRLMVALAGNATTGFQWDNVLLYEYAVLREAGDAEYRATPHPQTMVGFGGTFLFRYEAVDVGPQAFRFVYHRPWESVEPEQVFEFSAIMY